MDVIGLWLEGEAAGDLARGLADLGLAVRHVAGPEDLGGGLDGLVAPAGLLAARADAVRSLRERPGTSSVPVVAVLDPLADDAAVARVLELADETVRAPICAVELAARLRLLFRLRRALAAARREEGRRLEGGAPRPPHEGARAPHRDEPGAGLDGPLMESLGELVAGISREIASPVQYVGGNLEFLANAFARMVEALDALSAEALRLDQDPTGLAAALAELLEDEELRFLLEETPAAVRESREGLDRVAAMVRSLGRYAQPGTASTRAVDLAEVVDDVLTLTRGIWKYVAEVYTDFEPDLPPVVFPAGDLGRTLLLVLSRALRGLAPGGKGRIDVTARRRDEAVELTVRDDGAPGEGDAAAGPGRELALAGVMAARHAAGFEVLSGPGGTAVVLLLAGERPPAALGA